MLEQTGLVFDVKRFALEDGPGIRTTVFLKGCPLRCVWCHSPESISPHAQIVHVASKCIHCGRCMNACSKQAIAPWESGGLRIRYDRCDLCGACVEACPTGACEQKGRLYTPEMLYQLVEKDRPYYDKTGGGVTVSGGEATMQFPFLYSVLSLCRSGGIHTALDTCGFFPDEQLRQLAAVTDLFLYDLKHMDPGEHRRLTGVDNTRILGNLRRLVQMGRAVWVRFPLITGCNDSRSNIEKTLEYLRELDLHTLQVLPSNPVGDAKYAWIGETAPLGSPQTPNEGIQWIRKHAADYGITKLILDA